MTKKRNLSIKTATQLAIFLDNRPGTLAGACDALAAAKININALATEGGGFGAQGDEMLVRMIANDPGKAAAALGEVGAVAVQSEVLMIEGANKPGMLAKIADRLAKAEINIESIYVSASSDAEKCVVILRPSNVDQATRALGEL
jgi:hypothetical protein